MELGQRLKQARLDAGLSQRQLCGNIITRNMLSQIENGSARPSMDTLRELAARLQKPLSYFLEEEATSSNQRLILAARRCFEGADPTGALAILQDYEDPDPIFDPEYHLLQALCLLSLAQGTLNPVPLLEKAAAHGRQTPYYTPELERSRLLLLASETNSTVIVSALPADDRELLIRAHAALVSGDACACIRFLDAALHKDALSWLLLRADAAMARKDYTDAILYLQQAEPQTIQVYPKLEECFRQLEDYKMAYHYACKQR